MLVNQLNALGDAKSSAEKSLHESELAFQKAQADLKLKLQAYNEVLVTYMLLMEARVGTVTFDWLRCLQAAEEVAEEKKGDKDKVREVKRNVKVTLQFTDAAKPVLVPEKDTVRVRMRLWWLFRCVLCVHGCRLRNSGCPASVERSIHSSSYGIQDVFSRVAGEGWAPLGGFAAFFGFVTTSYPPSG